MRFEISPIIGMSQDGSVICSDQDNLRWTFTTIESPIDWNHPVSGNRQFGLVYENGKYVFYTRGVDRIAESMDQFLGDLPILPSAFEGADELWTKFQENLQSFVNNPQNDGEAAVNGPKIDRVDWELVMDVLKGDKPVSDLGCN